MNDRTRDYFLIWVILGAAFLLRLFFIPAPGYERDIYWFGTWMRTALEHGVSRVSQFVWCDYPPGYLYLLKIIGFLWKMLTGSPIPADNTFAMRFLVKIIPTLADILGAYALYRIAKPRVSRKMSIMVLIFYAFNPAAVFNSAVWGQVDSLTALLVIVSIWSLINRKISLSFGFAAIAVFVKFQAVVLIPILFIGAFFLEKERGIREAFKGGAIASLVMMLPFFWVNRAESVISVAFSAVGRYPYISLNAHNLWWLVGGTSSPSISDARRIGNAVLSYHDIGMIIFIFATMLIMWRLWRDLRRTPPEDPAPALFLAATLEMMAFYLFPTQMHERYIVPAIITMAALCIWKPGAWWLYVTLSLGVFISLATTLKSAYPSGLGTFNEAFPAGRQETYVLSVIFLAIFAILFFRTKDKRFAFFSVALSGILAVLIAVYISLPLKRSQLLSEWEPIEKRQEWGELHRNRTVDDRRLSVAGFIFRHGIGTHAHSKITYHLNRAFHEFGTAFGIDDEANRGQKIQFRILSDGVVLYDSGPSNSWGWPKHTRVNISGAEYLTLEVLDGGDGINYDHADWLEPKLFR